MSKRFKHSNADTLAFTLRAQGHEVRVVRLEAHTVPLEASGCSDPGCCAQRFIPAGLSQLVTAVSGRKLHKLATELGLLAQKEK